MLHALLWLAITLLLPFIIFRCDFDIDAIFAASAYFDAIFSHTPCCFATFRDTAEITPWHAPHATPPMAAISPLLRHFDAAAIVYRFAILLCHR